MRANARLVPLAAERLRGLPWPEIGAAFSLLAGWALISWALASFFRTWQVWPLSGGLLLITVFGWRYLYVMGRDGLYALTRDGKR